MIEDDSNQRRVKLLMLIVVNINALIDTDQNMQVSALNIFAIVLLTLVAKTVCRQHTANHCFILRIL